MTDKEKLDKKIELLLSLNLKDDNIKEVFERINNNPELVEEYLTQNQQSSEPTGENKSPANTPHK